MSKVKNGYDQGRNITVKWCNANSTKCSDPIPGNSSDPSAPEIDKGLLLQAFDENSEPIPSSIKILSISPPAHSINVSFDNKAWVLSLEGIAIKCTTNVNVEIGP